MSAVGATAKHLAEIEDAGLNASAPRQQLWMDGWLLRLSPGKAKRARCINALAPGLATPAEKLARAQRCFDDAGLPLIVRVTPFSQPHGLDVALAAAGLQRFDPTEVLLADLTGPGRLVPLPAGLALDPLDAEAFARLVGGLRGSPASQQRAQAERLAASPVPYRGFALRANGEMLACGQFARESDLVGLYDVFTAPAARHRGLARALCSALLRQAAAEGARTAYLQVDAGNAAALALYRGLGFRDGYRYHYRASEPDRC
ncbi:MAG: hypothetical protein ABS84_13235 [Rubrivivax sp. SCN 71-131]|mgnify:CR=1 FL=1|jgi:GNAT superfamily N-acetyltransferase|nr:MAG: hypothetical protein ABS84_13235 [Rubrivivax sp. SCN 71-131]